MQYLTGIHALNIPCSLNTCGDWHQSALKWNHLTVKNSENMLFKDWGIEPERNLPYCNVKIPVANHIRALLDMLQDGDFTNAQGMNENFISNTKYDTLIMDKIWEMRVLDNWDEIDDFMGKEYKLKWLKYKKERYYDGQTKAQSCN